MNYKNLHKIKKIIKREGTHYQFDYRGMKCELIRNTMNAWCGYVSFKINIETLLLYKLIDEDLLEKIDSKIYCHGGITYHSMEDDIIKLGFDCCHSGDLIPYMLNFSNICLFSSNQKYRTRHYVIKECKSIVFQLEEIFSTIK